MLQIKQDDKFYCRLLSKESSIKNPSFRVYYGVSSAGSVPFKWESQPGTPKNAIPDATIPPLTPPPSYQCNTNKPAATTAKKPLSSRYGGSSHRLLTNLLPRFKLKKPGSPTSPPSTLSSSSSISSSSTSSLSTFSPSHMMWRRSQLRRSRFSSSGSSSSSIGGYDEDYLDDAESPKSTMCFGMGRRNAAGGFRGCHCLNLVVLKKTASSVLGHQVF